MRGPTFCPRLVQNRVQNRLIEAVAYLLADSSEEKADLDHGRIMCGHDRFTFYRPTQMLLPTSFDGTDVDHANDDDIVDMQQFRTGPANIHLDLNPWWWTRGEAGVSLGAESLMYGSDEASTLSTAATNVPPAGQKPTKKKMRKADPSTVFQDFIKENNFATHAISGGAHIQAVMNFNDNCEEDGGTLVVPGFHRNIHTWCAAHEHLFKPVPWVTFEEPTTAHGKKVGEEEGGTSSLPSSSEAHAALLRQSIRVPMREGSVLLWHQTLAHGTRPNFSSNPRLAQFIKFFTRSPPKSVSKQAAEGEYYPTQARLERRAIGLARAFVREGCLYRSGGASATAAATPLENTHVLTVVGAPAASSAALSNLGLDVLSADQLRCILASAPSDADADADAEEEEEEEEEESASSFLLDLSTSLIRNDKSP